MTHRPNLLGLYHPGTTLLHRLPAGTKLLALCAFGTTVMVFRSLEVALVGLGIAIVLALWSRVNLPTLLRALRPILIVAALLLAFQWWQADLAHAAQVVARLLSVVLLATIVTATTAVDVMLDAIIRALGPFRRLGVNPERIGLAIALMLRAIPNLLDIASETRDAARARGLDRSPRALLVPMVVRSVAHAQDTGQALAARGLGDD